VIINPQKGKDRCPRTVTQLASYSIGAKTSFFPPLWSILKGEYEWASGLIKTAVLSPRKGKRIKQ